jgi:cytidylate kinase
MVNLQREIAEGGSCILEGRDIGTVVFPKAEYKFFLIANLEDRAKRRMLDLNSDGEVNSIEEVIEQIKKRDDLDSSRKNSPLRMSKDAVLIDTSYLSINAQINKIVDIIIN